MGVMQADVCAVRAFRREVLSGGDRTRATLLVSRDRVSGATPVPTGPAADGVGCSGWRFEAFGAGADLGAEMRATITTRRRWLAATAGIAAMAAGVGLPGPVGAQEGPTISVTPASAPEGEDLTITVTGTGCSADTFRADPDGPADVPDVLGSVVAIFGARSPGGEGGVGTLARGVADASGDWQVEILVPSDLPVIPLTAEFEHYVVAECTLGDGDDAPSFLYDEVPFEITPVADDTPVPPTSATTTPPTTAPAVEPAEVAVATPAAPVAAQPTYTG